MAEENKLDQAMLEALLRAEADARNAQLLAEYGSLPGDRDARAAALHAEVGLLPGARDARCAHLVIEVARSRKSRTFVDEAGHVVA